MKYSFKRSKPTFETLDGTICLDFQGQKAAISKRCADINAEMCHYMGNRIEYSSEDKFNDQNTF